MPTDGCQTWEVVGGGDKGGIMVREGRELTSAQERERLSTGALVAEVELVADRLNFERLTGSGPDRGWVSISLKGKVLLAKTDREPTEAEVAARAKELVVSDEALAAIAEASAALAPDAAFESANDAFTAMAKAWSCKAARPRLLLARGILLWRWSLLGKALAHLKEAEGQRAEGAEFAALALRLCLSQWPEARRLATSLGRKDVIAIIDQWELIASKMLLFHPPPESAAMAPEPHEIGAGMRQTDVRVEVPGSVEVGVRFLMHLDKAGQPDVKKPLLLVFHREDEDVDAYLPDKFVPLQSVGASAVLVGYRGFGFSTGLPSQSYLHTDADSICESLPKLFKEQGYPWPWPGRLTLFGSSLGSRVACYLAGTRGQLFDGGVVLETVWCGSYAPHSKPPPEPKEGPSLRTRFSNRIWNTDLAAMAGDIGKLCESLAEEAKAEHAETFCYVRGSEDLIHGFDGRLLILHGQQEMVVTADHAKRLSDAAESATRKLAIIASKDAETMRDDPKYADALKTFLSGR